MPTFISHANTSKFAQLGDINVWSSFCSHAFELNAKDIDSNRFELHFIESGETSCPGADKRLDAGSRRAYLLQNSFERKILCGPQTAQLCVDCPKARCFRLLRTEFGDTVSDLSQLRHLAEYSRPGVADLKSLATLLLSVGGNDGESDQLSIASHFLSESFLALFIEIWPREVDHRTRHVIKPFYIKRAVDWMEDNPAQKITLQDLSAVSGVSVRSLQLGFQKYFQLSPLGYLLQIRLQRAHRDLLSEPATLTIEDIAKRWGFSNPSKFAAQIRTNFGQNPLAIRRGLTRSAKIDK